MTSRRGRLAILSVIVAATLVTPVAGQRRGGPFTPPSPRAAAPIDLTGYWVSVVNEDWRHRMLMDPIQPKLDTLAARQRGDRNPFVVGAAEYQKFVGVMEGCTRVNLARRAVGQ